jgi:diguanylate cyclase (GGDEF)-like protein
MPQTAQILQMPLADPHSIRSILGRDLLFPHFQPIVDTSGAAVFGHEALIRMPQDWPWRNPDTLFAAARREGCTVALELECLRLALRHWQAAPRRGWVFVNLSADGLVQAMLHQPLESLLAYPRHDGPALSCVVVELTEHERVQDVDALQEALALLRRAGGALALDDFGDGRSSLRLWSELRPEFVKIDKYFVRHVHSSSHKLKTLRALQQLADSFGSKLIAEGVEDEEELMVVRDLGLHYAQGYYLGKPEPEAICELPAPAQAVLRSREIAVLPEERHASNRGLTAHALLMEAPALPASATHDEAAHLFNQHTGLHAVALVEDGNPVGLISRKTVQDLYLQLYFRDLYGRRPCSLHANLNPLKVDVHTPIEQLTRVLTSTDQRYLTEGYVITEGGRYIGLGTGEQLVRTVTEARIEAARHANPLTFLPGNVPITLHIERLLDNAQDFVACYADLNHFKVYNDHYGYWRGDEMIRLQAQCLVAACDPRRDFVGHVGGDDFVLLMQSADWANRVEAAVAQFNHRALSLFDEQARTAGGIQAEDRHGVERFHPCTTLSVGILKVGPGQFQRAEEVASAAALAKHHAKQAKLGIHLVDAREYLSCESPVPSSPTAWLAGKSVQ